MIDTHTHIYMPDSFPDGGKAAAARAVEAGVEKMVLPAVDRESVAPMLVLREAFPQNIALAPGLHPTEVGADWKAELEEILELTADVPAVAIGETGIDLHWDASNLSRQMDAFGEQMQLALERGLPVIVHSRDAVEETLEMVRSFSSGMPGIVFHSFTAGRPEAERYLEVAPEAFFGINGVVTFKNAAPLREALEWLPAERFVTETDAPFLAPVPHRGSTNESAYIPYIVKAIAALKGLPEDEMALITATNARNLFILLSP